LRELVEVWTDLVMWCNNKGGHRNLGRIDSEKTKVDNNGAIDE
jgi:hypothetical protein